MKKFFDFSITSRKEVKGENFAKVAVFSGEEDHIKVGEIIIKSIETDDYKAIFAKYLPVKDFNSEIISKLQIIEDRNNELRKMLNSILNDVNARISGKKDFLKGFILKLIITTCIDLESGIILIPTEVLDMHITNNDIIEKLGEDWLGIEVKSTPEIDNIVEKLNK